MGNRPGYILVLTVMILFSMTFLITRLLTRALASMRVNRMALDREQAKCLALGGVTITQALMAHQEKDQNKFFPMVIGILNQWQKFILTQDVDGVDGQIMIYISCEDGKLPINKLWDFEKKKFIIDKTLDAQKLLDGVILKSEGKKSEERQIIDELAKFFKDKDMPLESLTELFTNEYFKGLITTFFVSPPLSEKESSVAQLALSDMLTVFNAKTMIQPLFLSQSISEVFGLKKIIKDDVEIEKIIKPLMSKMSSAINWQKEWDGTLAKLYGKAYNQLSSNFVKLFDSTIGVTTISVLSYGKIGTVTQKIYAIIEKCVSHDNYVTYAIKKIYWI